MSIELRRPADAPQPVADSTGKPQEASGKPKRHTASADDAKAFEQAMARGEAPVGVDAAVDASRGERPGAYPARRDVFFGWPDRPDGTASGACDEHAAAHPDDAPGFDNVGMKGVDLPEADLQEADLHKANAHKAALGEVGSRPSDGTPAGREHGPTSRHRKTTVSAATDHAARPVHVDVPGAPQMAVAPAPDATLPTPLPELIKEYVAQLLIDEGTNGRRAVHIELKDDVLAGVSLAISESAGTLVSAFTCTSDAAYQKLGAHADELARSLALALGRPTRVEVRRDDLQDARVVEANAQVAP